MSLSKDGPILLTYAALVLGVIVLALQLVLPNLLQPIGVSPGEGMILTGVITIWLMLTSVNHLITQKSEGRDQYSRIVAAIEKSSIEDKKVRRLNDAIGTVSFHDKTKWGKLANKQITKEIESWEDFIKGVVAGQIKIREGDGRQELASLTAESTRSIDATSLSPIDNEFWQSEPESYIRAMKAKIDKGGFKIRRIFIYTNSIDDLIPAINKQIEIGVEVRTLKVADFRDVRDFVLFDDEVAFEVEIRLQTETASSADGFKIASARDTLQSLRKSFDNNWGRAKPVASKRS